MEAIFERFAAFEGWFNLIDLFTLIFIPLAVIEFFWDRIVEGSRRIGETVTNAVIAFIYNYASYLGTVVFVVVAHYFISPLALFEFEMTPLMWVAALVLADFLYYWMHRIEHEVRFFWAYHVVHHSSPEFNLTTAFRLSWVESLFEWLFFLPMLLLGFDAVVTLVAFATNLSYQTWIHTQKVGKLGVLDKIINTPSAHRVHHGSNPNYLDKNYGGVFLVWDHLFGTYQPEEEAVTFGITEPVNSVNPLVINFHEYAGIFRDIARAKSFKDAWRFAFGRPGWKAEAVPEKEG